MELTTIFAGILGIITLAVVIIVIRKIKGEKKDLIDNKGKYRVHKNLFTNLTNGYSEGWEIAKEDAFDMWVITFSPTDPEEEGTQPEPIKFCIPKKYRHISDIGKGTLKIDYASGDPRIYSAEMMQNPLIKNLFEKGQYADQMLLLEEGFDKWKDSNLKAYRKLSKSLSEEQMQELLERFIYLQENIPTKQTKEKTKKS